MSGWDRKCHSHWDHCPFSYKIFWQKESALEDSPTSNLEKSHMDEHDSSYPRTKKGIISISGLGRVIFIHTANGERIPEYQSLTRDSLNSQLLNLLPSRCLVLKYTCLKVPLVASWPRKHPTFLLGITFSCWEKALKGNPHFPFAHFSRIIDTHESSAWNGKWQNFKILHCMKSHPEKNLF